MNKNQFIQVWCPCGKESEMDIDLDMVIKDAIEERQCFMPSKTFE